MRKSFGNTWWGEQWLNALANIDFSNRLPRGRTYARKGTVDDLVIERNHITAKVQGSRPRPYRVDIRIPRLTDGEKKTLLDLITNNPLYLSKLLNRELPTNLYEDCLEEGIKLFPNSWNDLNGDCSCPDWAVPCKHMAAVLFLIANEIDKNPFLVFNLKGFDLLQALSQAGHAEQQTEVLIPTLHSLWQPFDPEKPERPVDEQWLQKLDFTQIPDCSEQLLALLKPKPLFYHQADFKNSLARALQQAARYTNKELSKLQAEESFDMQLLAIQSIDLLLDEEAYFLQASCRDAQEEVLLSFQKAEDLMAWLDQIPPGRIQDFCPSLQTLLISQQLARQLVLKQAILPQLIQTSSAQFYIRWLPAMLNESVRKAVELLEQATEIDLLFLYKEDEFLESSTSPTIVGLISFFCDQFLQKALQHDQKFPDDRINRLFFRAYAESFDKFEEREYPATIQLWLNNFFIAEKDHVPVLIVTEDESGFFLSIGVEERLQPLKIPMPLSGLFKKKSLQKVRMDILRDLALMTDYFPGLQQIVRSKGTEDLFLDFEQFPEFLFQTLPVIRLFGIKVLLPKALQKIARPTARLSAESTENGAVANSLFNINELLTFDWKIALGDQVVSVSDFQKMRNKYAGIVRLKDQYVFFDEQEIQQLIRQIEAPPVLDPIDALKASLGEEYEGTEVEFSLDAKALIKKLTQVERIRPPRALKAKLRPYQRNGFQWLYKNAQLGIGSILADDMGLGKTLQVISLLLQLKTEGAFLTSKGLVIVPTTLLTNWEQEIKRFAPDLSVHIYHGPKRSLKDLDQSDLLLTTYGVVRSEKSKLAKKRWLSVVIDEAQAIKNPGSAQTKAIKAIQAPIKIAMSGTPVENRLSEYWSIFDFSMPAYLGKLRQFKDDFARPIEVKRDQKQLSRFLKITSPFILRRLKTDKSIIKDLPDKIEQDQFCVLSQEQTGVYQNVIDNSLRLIESSEGIQRKGLVLKLITALKQVCNHPRQFLKKGAADPAHSGKCLRLFELLNDILQQREKLLLFTQYQEMGKLLVEMIQQRFGVEPPFLHGGVSRKKRDEMVRNFQEQAQIPILILSLKAGGTGLNLTAANHVIHFDLWWNPAVEAQATDRAYRIGQKKNVQVHRLITTGTFEEKINDLLQSKRELADLTVGTGETWIGDLSDQEIGDLVRLE